MKPKGFFALHWPCDPHGPAKVKAIESGIKWKEKLKGAQYKHGSYEIFGWKDYTQCPTLMCLPHKTVGQMNTTDDTDS